MGFIYMDESGDLGFDFSKSKTTKNFVIAFLFTNNHRSLDKIVSKTFQAMPKSKMRNHCGTLHCAKEHPKTKIKLLSLLGQKQDVSILIIRLNKQKVYTKLQDEKNALYNYVVNVLLDRVFSKKLLPLESIQFVASKKDTNKFLNNNFIDYIHNGLKIKHKANIMPVIKTPAQIKPLQIVDFIAWSVFQKYENNDESYFNLIKHLIIEDYLLFR